MTTFTIYTLLFMMLNISLIYVCVVLLQYMDIDLGDYIILVVLLTFPLQTQPWPHFQVHAKP